uniref:Uncharacterized protein n=1 Tax=Rhizophora mucronata TaxID=61149 RepID=A0A2P2QIF4_RHIMU
MNHSCKGNNINLTFPLFHCQKEIPSFINLTSSKIPFKHYIVSSQIWSQSSLYHLFQNLQCLWGSLNQAPPICNYIVTNTISLKASPKIFKQIISHLYFFSSCTRHQELY